MRLKQMFREVSYFFGILQVIGRKNFVSTDTYVCFVMKHNMTKLLIDRHKTLVKSQTSWYHTLFETLKQNQLTIVQGFATVHESTTLKTKMLNISAQRQKMQGENNIVLQFFYFCFIDVKKTSVGVVEYCWNIFQNKFDFSSYNGACLPGSILYLGTAHLSNTFLCY